MTTLSAEQTRAIARLYSDLAASLSDYRFTHWSELTKSQRSEIESHEWTLLTYSSNMTTHAIKVAVADAAASIAGITKATKKLASAGRKLASVKRAFAVATAAVTLGAAIASGHPLAIGDAVSDALTAADG